MPVQVDLPTLPETATFGESSPQACGHCLSVMPKTHSVRRVLVQRGVRNGTAVKVSFQKQVDTDQTQLRFHSLCISIIESVLSNFA
eukprot:4240526-Amphidinium_carterae.1